MSVLVWTVVLAASGAVTWWGSVSIERSSGALARRYDLPRLVQGTLVVAVGSSMPELATTVISVLVHDAFELGMATIVGSAIFNVLVIPGLSVMFTNGLRSDLRLAYRDALFYLTSVTTLLLVFSFALIYEPVSGQELQGRLTRLPAAIPLALYGLYLFLQWQENREMERDTVPEDTRDDGSRRTSAHWATFVVGMGAVVVGVEGLLRFALHLEDVLGTPSFFWGATVIAAVTSAPDAVVSIRSARAKSGEVSLGNVLGSNIFDLLVAIPIGVLIVGATTIRYGVAVPLMAALTLATIVLFTAMRTRLELSRPEGVVLLILYAVFVGWLVMETTGVTGWIG